MRRVKLILAMAAVLVGTLALQAGPAIADDLDCRDARGDLIRCDGDLYEPYNNNDYYFDDDYYYYSFNPYFFNPYFFSPYYYFDDDSYGCEGAVCLID